MTDVGFDERAARRIGTGGDAQSGSETFGRDRLVVVAVHRAQVADRMVHAVDTPQERYDMLGAVEPVVDEVAEEGGAKGRHEAAEQADWPVVRGRKGREVDHLQRLE